MTDQWVRDVRERGARATGVEAAPAATVALLRDAPAGLEVLLARRSSKLAFHGGAWVFPGGRIDPEDFVHDPEDLDAAARRAAVRETWEEAQVRLGEDLLVPFGHWTTPEISPKRFATWFFAAPAPDGDGVADGGETEALQWFTPSEALAARAAGEIELAPPQFVSLLALERYRVAADALAGLTADEPLTVTPRFCFLADGGAVCIYDDDAAYDLTQELAGADPDAVLARPGRRHRLLMLDTGWEYVRD